jgi:hypothetical protein
MATSIIKPKPPEPWPVICTSCRQTVTDARDPDAVRQLGRHRCPSETPALFDPAPAAPDPRRWTR